MPATDMKTLRTKVAESYYTTRITAWLMAAFGIVGALLSMQGLYGVMALTVGRQTREIGIRMALGAEARGVQRLVLARGMGLIAAGIAIGALAALFGAGLLGSMLYGVEPTDATTLATTALMLATFGCSACFVPARRATRVDPVLALRRH